MLDGTIIRAHQHSSGASGGQEKQHLGRSCGGFSTKIHAKVDALGLPLKYILTSGESHEITVAKDLIADDNCEYLLADRGYDADYFRDDLSILGISPVIPSRKNRILPRQYDKEIYKNRNQVERFFNRLKNFRRIATRYDKTAIMYMATLVIAGILLWLK
jgi:transposase